MQRCCSIFLEGSLIVHSRSKLIVSYEVPQILTPVASFQYYPFLPYHRHLQSRRRCHRLPAPFHHRFSDPQELSLHQSQVQVRRSL
ncbi:hypothetical protein CsatA_001783 [Cannabis sativa]